MAGSFPNRWKTLWEKEKLLVTSNFSFSCSVFKRLVQQTRKNQGLFGKGLTFLCLTCCCIFSLNYCYLCLFASLLLLTCVVTVLSEKGEKNVKVRVHAKIWCLHDVHTLILYSVESSKLTLFQTSPGFYVSAVQVF